MSRSVALAALFAVLLVSSSSTATAELTGIVFVDANGNGTRDHGELGRAGIAVSNGRDVVRTNVYGRYRLPERPGYVALTCPDQFDCPLRYREGAGDFPLEAAPNEGGFFFIQVSDVEALEDIADFAGFSSSAPRWLPGNLSDWLVLRDLRRTFGMEDDVLAGRLRATLARYRNVEGLSNVEVVGAYFDEVFEPGSELGRTADAARDSMAEIAALGPAFVISTGDMVLAEPRASPAAIAARLRFYREITEATGIPFYNTIGHNEITVAESPGPTAGAPQHGKDLFRRFHGPTHYSFDRGNFHFVALDTHHPESNRSGTERWSVTKLDPDVRHWLDADLAEHPNMVHVALNHEPFHSSLDGTEEYNRADDEGLFAKHEVRYSLAGHIHRNGFERRNGTTHITTGALSGSQWLLPADLHERGYRLFYARDGDLYHAWKRTGEALVAFLAPQQPRLREGVFLAVAVDRYGPFAKIEVSIDDEPAPFERWGDYFLRISLPYAFQELVLTATRENGEFVRAKLAPGSPDSTPASGRADGLTPRSSREPDRPELP